MSIKRDTETIKRTLELYKSNIDGMAAEYTGEIDRFNKEVEEMQGKYISGYIEDYKAKNMPSAASYRPQMQAARKEAQNKVEACLNRIEKSINDYFSGAVRPEFASKITAFSTLGLPLSDGEFKLLEQEAGSYFEKRLVAMLGASRTKQETQPIFEYGQPSGYQEQTVSDAYQGEKLPDADKVIAAFKQYKQSALRLLNDYCGPAAELNDALPLDEFGQQSHSSLVTITSNAFLRVNDTSTFLKAIDFLTKEEQVKPLSQNEKILVDLLIEPEWAKRFDALLPGKVRELAQKSDYAAELFSRDSRYSKFLETEERTKE